MGSTDLDILEPRRRRTRLQAARNLALILAGLALPFVGAAWLMGALP